MVDHMAMLVLRAEHDDLGVLVNFHIVTGRPIEKVIGVDGFLIARRIGRGQPTLQHIAPVRRLTEVAFQPLKEGSGVHSGGQRRSTRH